ncbi:unnamed protein product [Blepharisma stoltei]|uniref:Metallothionein n=1 Tax=Blepharisma stoltei TaxID=1481888 RepID=A0AAU9I4A1_9CILI|nr:unnamed protein product [Blepharisma stoltei]
MDKDQKVYVCAVVGFLLGVAAHGVFSHLYCSKKSCCPRGENCKTGACCKEGGCCKTGKCCDDCTCPKKP